MWLCDGITLSFLHFPFYPLSLSYFVYFRSSRYLLFAHTHNRLDFLLSSFLIYHLSEFRLDGVSGLLSLPTCPTPKLWIRLARAFFFYNRSSSEARLSACASILSDSFRFFPSRNPCFPPGYFMSAPSKSYFIGPYPLPEDPMYILGSLPFC